MPRRTFYRYKARIIREESQLFKMILPTIGNPEYRFHELIRSLEEAVQLNIKLTNASKLKPKIRMQACDDVIRYQSYLYRLAK